MIMAQLQNNILGLIPFPKLDRPSQLQEVIILKGNPDFPFSRLLSHMKTVPNGIVSETTCYSFDSAATQKGPFRPKPFPEFNYFPNKNVPHMIPDQLQKNNPSFIQYMECRSIN